MDEYGSDLERSEKAAKHDVKNSVFIDLFNIPKYQLQMYKTLHPEDTETTEDDIELITLSPVLLNMMYNDLGMLIKDRLLIFVEAQSTWSYNILIRILMYAANTYHDYITEHHMDVYRGKRLRMPKPEFYVIYTGYNKSINDVISLREDFFFDSEAKLDIIARVIQTENKDDIIGQYIIFSHIYDEQVRLHGRTKEAIENTIQICQDAGVLKEYLETRKKEVITMVVTLFDQDYIIKAHELEMKKETEIKVTIQIYQEEGYSYEEVVEKIVKRYKLYPDEAEEYMEDYWKKED